jgi:flagellar motor switch/type III secretory pathway protein FliN
MNLTLGHSLIQVEEVSLESPGWLFQAQQKRALAASLFVDLQCVAGHVLTYLSSDFSKVSTEISRKFAGTQLSTEKLNSYSAVTRDVALNLLIGETDLALNELKHLEVGDVVILRKPCGYWSDSRRELRVRLGDGDSLFLEGVVDESGESGMKIIVKNVVGVDQPAESYGGPMENELPGKKIFGDDSELIDGLRLTVRVEMSARRVRLDEIAQFREGQILPLGCRASDPVDLVVDGRRIAQGELVEIDGQLGVALKQVALGT